MLLGLFRGLVELSPVRFRQASLGSDRVWVCALGLLAVGGSVLLREIRLDEFDLLKSIRRTCAVSSYVHWIVIWFVFLSTTL